MVAGQHERGRSAGTGVLDVHHGNVADPHGAQGDLPADHVLTLHVTLGGIAEKGGLQIVLSYPRVHKRGPGRLARELLDVLIGMPTEWGHSHSNYKYVFQRASPASGSRVDARPMENCMK